MDKIPGEERRHWSRLSVSENGLQAMILRESAPLFFSQQVLSLSPSGVGVIVPRQLKNGATVSVRLSNRAKTFTCEREAQVVYNRPFQGSGWVIGCEFAECLCADDVLLLLAVGEPFASFDRAVQG